MAHTKTIKCEKCGLAIRANNFNRHYNACGLKAPKKVRGIDFDPNWGYKDGSRVVWNKGLSKDTDERVKAYAATVKLSARSPWHGRCLDPIKEQERRKKISAKLKGVAGGYRANAGRSKKFKVFDSFGKHTVLQSTYEYVVYEILCELGIRWIRPSALKYNQRNYFADFYLIDFGVYLDPKNDYKAAQDKEKIKAVIEQNNVKLVVLLKHQLTKYDIQKLCS